MKTYQSCGKISIEGKEKSVIVKTMLPTLKDGGKYKYTGYYNISSEGYFGVLGILMIDGEPNVDLRKYDGVNSKFQVDALPINLNNLKPLGSGKSFDELKNGDKIHFMCFHDDSNNLSEVDLIKFQKSLPLFPAFEPDDREPKVGNGGILTFEGC